MTFTFRPPECRHSYPRGLLLAADPSGVQAPRYFALITVFILRFTFDTEWCFVCANLFFFVYCVRVCIFCLLLTFLALGSSEFPNELFLSYVRSNIYSP